ncbi:MAG: hypothetical protein DRH24_11350, partial [Deltaproteobacteria bacterium]
MEVKEISDITFNEYLNEEKLMGSKCKRCGSLFTPPRPICIDCYSTDMEWIEMKGTGKLLAFTCISVGPPSMIEEGFDRKHPYCVGVVRLDEGTKVDARIEGIDPAKPETIKVGMSLGVKYLHRKKAGEKLAYLAFEP